MNKAIVTVLAHDRLGIIAAVSARLSEMFVNILDITQTVWEDNVFVMLMLVEIGSSSPSFHEISESLQTMGQAQGISIRIQREDIFNAMHTI